MSKRYNDVILLILLYFHCSLRIFLVSHIEENVIKNLYIDHWSTLLSKNETFHNPIIWPQYIDSLVIQIVLFNLMSCIVTLYSTQQWIPFTFQTKNENAVLDKLQFIMAILEDDRNILYHIIIFFPIQTKTHDNTEQIMPSIKSRLSW